ncbi:MAG TPA: hypothetical protein VMG31_09125 [Verrucomicrobiae bacterium]|nr:hypothetical protein [Verrucomicrobiae bacterium]
MVPAVRKQVDVARLTADLAAAAVELLSAQCASDRIRLQYSPQDIVKFGDPQTLHRALNSVEALNRFFSQISAQMRQHDGERNRKA